MAMNAKVILPFVGGEGAPQSQSHICC